jgi:hypothetical protein
MLGLGSRSFDPETLVILETAFDGSVDNAQE